MLSVHDPEMRHGHKSSHRRFNGHKAAIVVDTDSQLITAVDVLPGNAPDNLGHWNWWSRARRLPARRWRKPWATPPTGTAGTRQTFAEAGRQLVARVPGRPDRQHFPKDDFHLDLAAAVAPVRRGRLPAPWCRREEDGCRGSGPPLAGLPVRRGGMSGMPAAVPVHRGQRQEGTQSADPPAGSPAAGGTSVAAERCLRRVSSATVVVEHRLARLVQLGIRQSRYFGRVKTRFQLYLAATVANLTLVAGKIGLSGSTGGGGAGHCVVLNDVHAVVANAATNSGAVRLGQLWSRDFAHHSFTAATPFPNQGFPARFLGN